MFNKSLTKSFLLFPTVAIGIAIYLAYSNDWGYDFAAVIILLVVVLTFLLAWITNLNISEFGEVKHVGATISIRYIDQNNLLNSIIWVVFCCWHIWLAFNSSQTIKGAWLAFIAVALFHLNNMVKQLNSGVVCSVAGISDKNNVMIVAASKIDVIKIKEKRIAIYLQNKLRPWVIKKRLLHTPDWPTVVKHFEEMKQQLSEQKDIPS